MGYLKHGHTARLKDKVESKEGSLSFTFPFPLSEGGVGQFAKTQYIIRSEKL